MKTFWFFNHYASTPDQPSTSAFFVGRELVRRGNRVTFFASAHNYYFQRRTKGRRWSLWSSETVEGVTFVWISTTPASARPVLRMVNMLSYAIVAFLAGLFRRERPDYVIGTCPHPFAGATAWVISLLRGGRFIYEIRDIWPESLERYNSGLLWRTVIAFFGALQKFLYRRARLITSVLPGIATYFRDIGVEVRAIAHLPNCIELSPAGTAAATDAAATDDGTGAFRFYYVGGFSRYQGLPVLIDAVGLLAKDPECPAFEFHLVGAGSEKEAVVDYARQHGSPNVHFHPPVPRQDVQSVLARADCNIFHLLDIGEALRYGVSPNKLIEYLLSGKPMIFALPFEWPLLSQSAVGFEARCGDAESLAGAMRRMLDADAETRQAMGANARAVCAQFDVRKVVDDFMGVLP
ncbi:MAG: glycosyltransferase family 4 protein [Aliihoeflea sp.]